MSVRTLSRLAILVAVVTLPVGAALASYALPDAAEPVVPAEVRIGGADPIPASNRAGRPAGETAADPTLQVVVVSQLPPIRETSDDNGGTRNSTRDNGDQDGNDDSRDDDSGDD